MMESAPASSFEMGEAEVAFEFLVVALDAPAQFGRVDENVDGRVFGQGRKPAFVGSFSPSGHSMRSHSSGWGVETFQSREAGRIRMAAKREDKVSLEPSRHGTMRQASSGSLVASVLAETGLCLLSRRMRDGGRPRPLQGLGGSGSTPGGQTLSVDCTPTT